MKTKEANLKIYLDIETFSGEKPSLDSIKADGRIKDPAKIEADKLKKQDAAWRKQSLDPYKGEVFCIGVAVNDGEAYCLFGDDEEETMKELEEFMVEHKASVPTIYGHNIIDFDAYWLFVKGLKYRLPTVVSTFNNKYVLKDSMLAMDGCAWKKMTSLDKMAYTLLGKSAKEGVDGSMVHDMVLEGKIDEILEYCNRDVEVLRECCNVLELYGLI